MRKLSYLIGAISIVLLVFAGIGITLSSLGNHETPPSSVGYKYTEPLFGKAEFVGLQTGPTSTGLVWRQRVINIPITPLSFEESFRGRDGILAKDNLKIEFGMNLVLQVRQEWIQQYVEGYTTLLTTGEVTPEDIAHNVDFQSRLVYNENLRQPLRTFCREEVENFDGLKVKDNTGHIGTNLMTRAEKLCEGTPFKVVSVNIGAPQSPPIVVEATNERLGKTQELEQRKTEVEIAKRDKEKRRIAALGIAEAMGKVNAMLTPEYILHEALQAHAKMVAAPNHTTIYAPQGQTVILPTPAPTTGSQK